MRIRPMHVSFRRRSRNLRHVIISVFVTFPCDSHHSQCHPQQLSLTHSFLLNLLVKVYLLLLLLDNKDYRYPFS